MRGQRDRVRDRVKVEDMVCAFMQGKHERLGRGLLRILPIDICKTIAEVAATYEVANSRYITALYLTLAKSADLLILHDICFARSLCPKEEGLNE